MTVADLIAKLEACDPGATVYRTDPTGHEGANEVERVEEYTLVKFVLLD